MENPDEIIEGNQAQQFNDVEEQKIISLKMFFILYISSFGLYEMWWMYKAWRFFKQKDNLKITPTSRAFYSIFFMIPLFNKILSFAKDKGYSKKYSSIGLYICFIIGAIIGSFLSKHPEPLWLISIFNFVFLIPPFNALNYAKQNSNDFVVTEQTSFNKRQKWLIAIGTFFWGLLLIAIIGLK